MSTTVGVERLPVVSDQDLVFADEPANIADAVVRLLKNPGEARALAAAAQGVVARRDWSVVARNLVEKLETLQRPSGAVEN